MPLSLGDFAPPTATPTTPAPSAGGSLSLSDFAPAAPAAKTASTPTAGGSLSLSDFNPSAPASAGAALATKTPATPGISATPLSDPTAETNYLNTQAPILTQRGKDLQTQSGTIVTSKVSLDKLGSTYDSMESNLTTLKAGIDSSAKNLQAYENYNMAPQAMVDAHNAKVAAYNAALSKFQGVASQYKQSVDAYNTSVGDYSSKSDQYNSDVNNFNQRVPLPGPEYAQGRSPDTFSLQNKTMGMNNPISDASTLGIIKNTIEGLPKAAWNGVIGVGSVLEYLATPEGQMAASNLGVDDIVKGTATGVLQFFGTAIADVAGIFTGAKTFNIGGVQIKNIQQSTVDAVNSGTNPFVAVLDAVPQSIFDGLMVAGMAEKVFSPRESVIATGVKTNDLPGEAELPQTKSGRISKAPVIKSSAVPNEAVEALQKEQGVTFKKYDPANPTYFRTTIKANGVIKGEIVQLKPSYFDIFKSKFGGDISRVPDTGTNVVFSQDRTVSQIKDSTEKPPVPSATPTVPTADMMAQHLEAAKNEVANPTTETPTMPAAMEHPLRAAKAEAMQNVPMEQSVSAGDNIHQGKTTDNFVRSTFNEIKDTISPTTGKYDFANKDEAISFIRANSEKPIMSSVINAPFSVNQITEDHLFGNNRLGADQDRRVKLFGPGLEIAEKTGKLISIDKTTDAGKGITYYEIVGHDPKIPNTIIRVKLSEVNKNGKAYFTVSEISGGAPVPATPSSGRRLGGITTSDIDKGSIQPSDKEVKSLSQFNKLSRANQEKVFSTLPEELQKEITGLTDKDLQKGEDPTITRILSGQTKIKIPESIKTDVIERIGKGNYMRIFRTSGPHSSLDEVAADNGFNSDEELISAIDNGLTARRMALQGGFINPGAIVDSVKEVAQKTSDYITATNANIDNSQKLNDTLYTATKNSEADTITNHKALVAILDEATPAETKNIDDYRDQKRAGLELPQLTEREQSFNALIDSLYKDQAEKVAFIKDSGTPFSHDDYDHRIVKDKGGTLDKLVASKDKLIPKGMGTKKNVLKKSAPALKKQEMFNVTNNTTGERMVIHKPGAKDKNITGFKDKKLTDLGPQKQNITPRTKEFFDQHVTPVLEQVAKNLGVTHKIEALKGNKAGVSLTGKKTVKTHPGAPERVLIHEIGHQADEKFGMQAIFAKDDARNYGRDTMKDEQRALADLRAGEGAKPSYQSYVRKGEEKMAVMFEAYLHVPDQFQEVAPNLYEKFDEFLKNTPELAPIRDIEKSLELGLKKNGGQHVGGIKKNQFISADGTHYTIGQATKNEIEQHSNVQYFHNPFVAAFFSHEDVTRAFEATKLLESLKNDPKFTDRTMKVGEGNPPDGWKMTNLPQFQGVYMEPHQANVLNAFGQELKNGDDPVRWLTAANEFILNYMFLGPVRHLMNVGASAIINRGIQWVNPMAYPRLARTTIAAVKSIITQDEDYIKLLRAGVPMQAVLKDQQAYRQAVLDSLGEPQNKTIKGVRQTANLIGKFTPFHWAHTLTWPGNNIILHQGVSEELARKGLTIQSATVAQIQSAADKVTRIIPNYRLPIAIRRLPKYVTKNTLLFASYRLNMVRTFVQLGKTLITGNDTPGEVHFNENGKQSYFSKQEWKARGEAFSQIFVMFLLAAVAEPFINKELQKWTGNNNAYMSPPGQLADINNANKLISGKINIGQYIQTITDLAPGTKEILQEIFNLDFFTGKAILPQGVNDLSTASLPYRGAHIASVITPFDLTQKLAGGNTTWQQILGNQIGIYTPKGNNLVNILQGSSAPVLQEIARLMQTATPPSSTDITKRVDVQMFQAQVTPAKFTEAMNQYTGLFVSNIAKLMTNQYTKPATATSVAKLQDYQGSPDAQKSKMIDMVKDQTIAAIEKAYHYNKAAPGSAKTFEGNMTEYGSPTIANLSKASPDDGVIAGKNPKGEPEYQRFSLAVSSQIKTDLFNKDSYWKDNGYTEADTQLDHIVPIEAGGTMTKNNLMLISKYSDQLNQPFEDYLGARYKAGTISRANAIKASIDYKINKSVTFTDIKNGKY